MKFIIAFGIICSFLYEINAAEFTDCGKYINIKHIYIREIKFCIFG